LSRERAARIGTPENSRKTPLTSSGLRAEKGTVPEEQRFGRG
jgi:hypothetical protein